ncbi:uncharacterized protein LOC125867696 isoform X2 [Solanum stenotomum]|uniref:uncharacterized protein LOC125867696 isoform X1 n=1 Tax=Solanum stenotomum TaxID=172797 RepID=UPI0020D0E84B|nr:uncharacterized protein LOC125867696 isoform X1 [Solanum stenotomum]XP_049404219.1 uncharacterized protein LOC125867696 isoform X2 [Solanum stenotomum]
MYSSKVSNNKNQCSNGVKNIIMIISFILIIYLMCFNFSIPNTKSLHTSVTLQNDSSSSSLSLSSDTNLEHIVFGIASNENAWSARKELVKMWWKPGRNMRGCVFLEKMPPNYTNNANDSSLPPICISGDTSRFKYTFRGGTPSAIRVARVVTETVALNHSNVRWYVFGDDDTVFFTENLLKTLSKYDHGLWYYIGSNSEHFLMNKAFSYEMAFGGAGIAISSPLAKVLGTVFDACIERYPHLFGSDARIYSCLAELGVGLTHEPGFHQLDVRGNMFGVLAAHTLRPLVSLHHLEMNDPIFPNMTKMKSLEHLYNAAKYDPHRILQQTVCYDRWYTWTVSVSWGYSVQVFSYNIFLPDALRIQESYFPWQTSDLARHYDFDTRPYEPDPCKRQLVYFLHNVSTGINGQIKTIYRKKTPENCTITMVSPRRLEEIRVVSQKLEIDRKRLLSPRRQCCDVLPSTSRNVMDVAIRECKEDELIFIHP